MLGKIVLFNLLLFLNINSLLHAMQPQPFHVKAEIPVKDDSIFRVMSYNVHYWMDPDDTYNALDPIIEVVRTLSPDIALLEEVSPNAGFGNGPEFTNSIAMKKLQAIGFKHFYSCNTLRPGHWFGNVIASKVPLTNSESVKFSAQQNSYGEVRCYIKTVVQLPQKGDLYIYLTHLENQGTDDIRLRQVKQISEEIQTKLLKNKNVIIAADYNATRAGSPIQFLQKNGFLDNFSHMGLKQNSPTHIGGAEIDFLFLSPGWNLPLAGSYIYNKLASDHFPVILDIKLDLVSQPKPESPQPKALITDQAKVDELIKAIKQHKKAVVESYLKQGISPNALGSEGESALHYAILTDRNGDIVKLILDMPDVKIDIKNSLGQTPLYLTIDNRVKGLDYAQLLINKGADINARTNKNATPMHAAAKNGRTDIIRLLLDKKADITIKDQFGATAYQYAIDNNYDQIAELIENSLLL